MQEQLKVEGANPVAIAKAAGFTIKRQDLHAAASELSDEDLEAATGGGEEATSTGFLTKQPVLYYCLRTAETLTLTRSRDSRGKRNR